MQAALKPKYFLMTVLIGAVFGLLSPAFAANDKTDAEIIQILIKESIANYSGPCPCPCPYNIMSNGRRCGKFSAHTKPGGATPLCYAEDVTPQMIQRYRNR